MKIGEVAGLKIFVSPEEFEEIKKQKIIQENKILEEQQEKIDKYEEVLDKIKEVIKSSGGYKGMCTQPQTDTFSYILELLEEIDE